MTELQAAAPVLVASPNAAQASDAGTARANRFWRLATYAWALLGALGLTYFIWHMPFQVSDFIGNLLAIRQGSLLDVFRDQPWNGPYLRPLVWVFFKVVFDLAHGHYVVAYKLAQVIQVGVLFVLFARLLGARTWKDFCVVPLAFAVLLGMHTFGGFVFEVYPVNAHLTVTMLMLAALVVAESRGGWWADVLGPCIVAAAVLTFELGLLAWVIVVAARLAGARGASRKGVAASTAIVVAYFLIRFLFGSPPGLNERSSGYLFAMLEPSELQARFGAHPIWFYAYNVLSSFSSILFSEPRAGIWRFTASILNGGDIPPWQLIAVVTSTFTTAVITVFSLKRARRWARLDVAPGERLVFMFWVVALANSAISFPYTKNQIIAAAGCFYALAAYVAVRAVVREQPHMRLAIRAFVVAWLFVLSCGWAVRSVGLAYNMHRAAYNHRNDWVTVEQWLRNEQIDLSPSDAEFVRTFKREMLATPVPPPFFVYGRWMDRYFDEN